MNLPQMMSPATACLLGECLDDGRGSGDQRYQIGLPPADGQSGTWRLRALVGLDVRKGDQVLLLAPVNGDEPLIVGVVGRPTAERPTPKNTIVLDGSDIVRVVTSDGRPLVEVGKNQHGPVVRLCGRDVQLDVPGHLRIAAGRLDLESRKGDVRITADEEVIVQGDMIRLN